MKELEYPFDAEYLLKKKKSIKQELLSQNINFIDKKIAILGGSTTSNIKLMLELFLLNNGIRPEFYESEYNQYYEDAVFGNAEFDDFKPDIIYICTSCRNITEMPSISRTVEYVETILENEINKYRQMWSVLKNKFHCPIIQNNFEYPSYRIMGNYEASDPHGTVNFITRLNMKFYEYAQSSDDFFICDINYISSQYGLHKWSDAFYWHMYKYALCVPAIPYLAFNVSNIIKSIYGKNKKGFVLDLDNTLWGGIIGDDGVDNIMLGQEVSGGQAYSEFQKYIKAHKELGIVLNVNSKNEYENALLGLNHPDADLKPEDFICIKANWNPKDRNFNEIAQELNVLPESLVFIDDNPAERAIVTGQIPSVSAPEIDVVEHYIDIIDKCGYFEVTNISADDLKRNDMYRENAERAKEQAAFDNYEDYLLSLDMKATIRGFESIYMSRIAQLTNKSNQFNLTTKRYTQNEIEDTANDEQYITLYGKLEDKFGDNGVVSVIIGHIIGDQCHVDLWIMSCRVLKRDMEFAMMDSLVNKCKERKVSKIVGYYYPTAKNKMVKDFYAVQGFEKISDINGDTVWEFNITEKYENKNKVINVED